MASTFRTSPYSEMREFGKQLYRAYVEMNIADVGSAINLYRPTSVLTPLHAAILAHSDVCPVCKETKEKRSMEGRRK